jgi:hypothetical protein
MQSLISALQTIGGKILNPLYEFEKIGKYMEGKGFFPLNFTNLFGIVGIGVRDGKHELRILRKAF